MQHILFSDTDYVHNWTLFPSLPFTYTVFKDSFRRPNPLTVECVWNVMAHAQKPDFVFQPNGRVQLNRRECQFSRLLAAEVCESAVVMLDTPCSEVVWRVLATHSIRQFPLHSPSRASLCAITFQLDSNKRKRAWSFQGSGNTERLRDLATRCSVPFLLWI